MYEYMGHAFPASEAPASDKPVAQPKWFELPDNIKVQSPSSEISPGFTTQQLMQRFCNYVYGGKSDNEHIEAAELNAKNNPWLLPIGVELEIPTSHRIKDKDQPKYNALRYAFLLAGGPVSCAWEFQPGPSYSWLTQAAILSDLFKFELIPVKYDLGSDPPTRRIAGSVSNYSLHCNISVPRWTTMTENEYVHNDLSLIAIASGFAFSSPERLATRKTDTNYRINGDVVPLEKTVDRKDNARVEIRTLGFGNSSSYRQLGVIQRLVTAAYAYWLVENNEAQQEVSVQRMHDIWSDTRKRLAEELEHPLKDFEPLSAAGDITAIPSMFSLRRESLRKILLDKPHLPSVVTDSLLRADLRFRRDAKLP